MPWGGNVVSRVSLVAVPPPFGMLQMLPIVFPLVASIQYALFASRTRSDGLVAEVRVLRLEPDWETLITALWPAYWLVQNTVEGEVEVSTAMPQGCPEATTTG